MIELLTVIAVVVILAALALAGMGKARQSARIAQSLGNLRTIGGAINGFLQDNKQRFPSMGTDKYATPPRWSTRIAPFGLPVDGLAPNGQDVSSPALFSPFVEQHADSSDYGANAGVFSWLWTVDYNKRQAGFGLSFLNIINPSRLVTVASCRSSAATGGCWYFIPTEITGQSTPPTSNTVGDWSTGKIQVLFADSHVEAIPVSEFYANARNYLLPEP